MSDNPASPIEILLSDMRVLLKQATTEKSHFYTAKVLRRAIAAIEELRQANARLLGLGDNDE